MVLSAALVSSDASARPPTTVAPSSIAASFAARSYRPGERATLRLGTGGAVSIQLIRAGAGTLGGAIRGAPAGASRRVLLHGPSGAASLPVGAWASGVYFARAVVRSRGTTLERRARVILLR